MFHSIYITGAESRSGKSLVVLGLMELLSAAVPRVGFFRPIIDGAPESDRLLGLVRTRYAMLQVPIEQQFGVVQSEAVQLSAEGRQDELVKRILGKFKQIEEVSDVVVCVGSDFSSLSTSLELEFNVELAKALDCLLIPVVRGLGRSASEVANSMLVLEEFLHGRHAEILAAFVNRVERSLIEEVRTVLARTALKHYVLPERPSLEKPTVGDIACALGLEQIHGDAQSLGHVVETCKIAAMQLQEFLAHIGPGTLVITPGNRTDIILGSLAANASGAVPGLAGILLTNAQRTQSVVAEIVEGLAAGAVPVLVSPWDTFTTALKVNEVEGSLLPENESKLALALGVMETAVDGEELQRLLLQKPAWRMTPLLFEYQLIQRAKQQRKRIVLPEGNDDRVLRAAEILSLRDVVDITLLGNEELVKQAQSRLGLRLLNVDTVDPATSPWLDEFARSYAAMRQHKGMTLALARDTLLDVSYFGTMMVYCGHADGMVSGAVHTTQHTMRPAFEIIRTREGVSLVSSVFFMCLEERVLVYGDCAINPNPDAAQLADIAIASSETAKMFGIEPRTAMLSYSTGSSGKGGDVERVREAARIAHEKRPDLKIEGPIQYDAAVDESVAMSKLPDSDVAGHATVLIFPDLNTGNNTYKAVQRSAGALAIGPVMQGLRKPVNDLSRGCTITDIVNTVAITAIQAQQDAV